MKYLGVAFTGVCLLLALLIALNYRKQNAKTHALSISNTGVITGTPNAEGVFLIKQPLTITSTFALPTATVGVPYVFTFTAAGGNPPYAWAVAPIDDYPQFFPLPDGVIRTQFFRYDKPGKTLVVKVSDGESENVQAVYIRVLEHE